MLVILKRCKLRKRPPAYRAGIALFGPLLVLHFKRNFVRLAETRVFRFL